MAQQKIITIVDDLDNSITEDVKEGVRFWLDRDEYEIDLGPDNLEELEGIRESYQQDLERFIAVARKVKHEGPGPKPGRKAAGGTGPARPDKEQNQAIRDWARKRGMKVSDRGRISAEIVEAFKAEH